MQARIRNLSTGEFEPKCAQRHHAIYFSSSPGRKYTAHFGSYSPVSVNTKNISIGTYNLSPLFPFSKFQEFHSRTSSFALEDIFREFPLYHQNDWFGNVSTLSWDNFEIVLSPLLQGWREMWTSLSKNAFFQLSPKCLYLFDRTGNEFSPLEIFVWVDQCSKHELKFTFESYITCM